MSNIVIEPFTLVGLEQISSILANDFDNFWSYDILKKELSAPSSFYLCCKQNNNIVGFAGISIILDTAELNNIVIKKSCRGNGFASALLNELIKFVKSKKCKQINLEVSSKNPVAISLYKKFGFKQVGLRPKYYNGTDDALLFSLFLEASV